MRAAIIAAPETFLRLPFFYLRREHRKLLFQLGAAAMGALTPAFIARVFKQFSHFAAVITLIFVNRHCFLVSKVNFVPKGIYVMIIRAKYQYQTVSSPDT
jgi:hypothetical protein